MIELTEVNLLRYFAVKRSIMSKVKASDSTDGSITILTVNNNHISSKSTSASTSSNVIVIGL